MRRAGMLLLVALAAAACDGSGTPPAPAPAPAAGTGAAAAKPTPFRFRLLGSRPWNETVYAAVGDEIDSGRPYKGALLEESGIFVIPGAQGAPYHIRSEVNPKPSEERMLWMVEARGTLGAGAAGGAPGVVEITSPPRAVVTLHAPAGTAGPDAVTFFDESTRTCATAYRDPQHAMFLAIWDAHGGNAYRNVAPPRPWRIPDIKPGMYVIGAHTAGHHWTARRVTIGPDAALAIDAGAAPEGGGTVVVENDQALLLLDGDLAIPAPRITTSLVYRSTWKNVPSGAHRVRYPDGREVPVVVKDGATTKLGR